MFWMIRNSAGKPDSMLTFSIISLGTVLVKVLAAGLVVQLANKSVTIGGIDGTTIAALLSPTLGSYVARRYTDRKFENQNGVANVGK
jgi:hypothetical protein